ncbi:MAG: hypothetical protein ACRD3T_16225, partial [Terriglobia bacterium]
MNGDSSRKGWPTNHSASERLGKLQRAVRKASHPLSDMRNQPCLAAGIPERAAVWNGGDIDYAHTH